MPSMVVELHDSVFDAGDKAVFFKRCDVVAIADRPLRSAERGPEVLHDVSAARFRGGSIEYINAVLAGLEIPVVHQQIGDDEPLELTRADERTGVPCPLAVLLVPAFQPKASRPSIIGRPAA